MLPRAWYADSLARLLRDFLSIIEHACVDAGINITNIDADLLTMLFDSVDGASLIRSAISNSVVRGDMLGAELGDLDAYRPFRYTVMVSMYVKVKKQFPYFIYNDPATPNSTPTSRSERLQTKYRSL